MLDLLLVFHVAVKSMVKVFGHYAHDRNPQTSVVDLLIENVKAL
jgi:predicted nucleotidyltransferase